MQQRTTVEDNHDALLITVDALPRHRYFVRSALVLAYFGMMLWIFADWVRAELDAPVPLLFAAITLFLLLAVVRLWLNARASHEALTLSASGLVLETTIWPRRGRQFSLASVRAVRWAPSPWVDTRAVVLDVDGRARRFGADLDEAEGQRIVTLIEERLQRLRAAPYR